MVPVVITAIFVLCCGNTMILSAFSCSASYPWTPYSDQCLISRYSNTAQLNIKVVRKKEVIIKWQSSWLFNKLSSLPCMDNIVKNIHAGNIIRALNHHNYQEICRQTQNRDPLCGTKMSTTQKYWSKAFTWNVIVNK